MKPLIAIVRDVATTDDFDKRNVHNGEYVCEFFGGNHRGDAFFQLTNEDTTSVKVQLFTGKNDNS